MKLTHKIKVAVVASVATVAIAGAAFAYFTTTGTGSGSGSVGTSSVVTITGTVTNALYPGTSSPVTFSVNNPSTGHQYVNTISLVSVAPDAGHAACVVTDFSMAPVSALQDVGTGVSAITAQGTLVMANQPLLSQDACKNATLTLTLASN